VTLEAAVSRARYDSLLDVNLGICEGDSNDPLDGCYQPQRAPDWVWWVAGDIGWETRWSSGFRWLPTFSATVMQSF
jgi:hypothetical protein